MTPWRSILVALASLGCERGAPAPGELTPPTRTERLALRAAPTPASGGARSSAGEPRRAMAVLRAAALGRACALAITEEGLQRYDGARWGVIPVVGVTLRDVVAARGALWLLARGEGSLARRTLVLRSRRGDDLEVAVDLGILPDHDPRALEVASVREGWIAGARPTLLRVGLDGRAGIVDVGLQGGPAVGVVGTPDEVLSVALEDGSTVLFRWGGSRRVPNPVATPVRGGRHQALVGRDGAVWRPRPGGRATGERPRPWLGPSGLEPVAAVAVPGESVLEVARDGRSAVWRDRGWQPVPGLEGGGPVVSLSLGGARGGPVAIRVDGGVFEYRGARWVAVTGP